MPSITIEVFPAKYGESFLVTCHDIKPFHILIDMGFADTYEHYIKERLKSLHEQGQRINLLVFTHIDIDHIQGGLSFLKDNGKSDNPTVIGVDNIWYNAYRHIAPGRMAVKIDEYKLNKIDAYVTRGMKSGNNQDSEPIGGRKGSVLGALILDGGYNWNKQFEENAIFVKEEGTQHDFCNVKIQVLSPNIEDLRNLELDWKQELMELGLTQVSSDPLFDDAFEVMVSDLFPELRRRKPEAISGYEQDLSEYVDDEICLDDSSANLSSISLIIEFNEKKVLFLADAVCSRIYENLPKYGYLEPTQFSAIKVAHHGSSANTDEKFLNMIDAPLFIISTNGRKFGHPDLSTIAKIVCRKTSSERTLVVNYEEVAAKLNHLDWTTKYKFRVNKPEGTPIIIEI
ncbi:MULTISPECIES: hypothetical protein [Sporomusa]|uniref:hypothetical protein n=1 Tax=Sporomusa TaxID=2375 RepID=UPI0031596B04